MHKGINCPVELVPINENKVRMVALLVLLSGLLYIFTNAWYILVYLAADFLLRTTGLERYSIYARLSGLIIRYAQIKNKPVDRAPKRFAAGIGFVFVLSILGAHALLFKQTAILLTWILCVFAFLESVLAVCVGCHVYHSISKLYKLIVK
jgi:hypothetical protein